MVNSKFSRIRVSRVYEDFPVLVGRLIHTFGERFGDLAQLNSALAGFVLKRLREVNASRGLGVLPDCEGGGLLLRSKHVP